MLAASNLHIVERTDDEDWGIDMALADAKAFFMCEVEQNYRLQAYLDHADWQPAAIVEAAGEMGYFFTVKELNMMLDKIGHTLSEKVYDCVSGQNKIKQQPPASHAA